MGETRIEVSKDGPYLLEGLESLPRREPLPDEDGNPTAWEVLETIEIDGSASHVALCRCGRTGTTPFCDGSHLRVGFDGTETASTASYDEQATVRTDNGIEMGDVGSLCAHAKFCQRNGDAWHLLHKADMDDQDRDDLVEMIDLCPTGRLTHRSPEATTWEEPDLPEAVFLTKDGPICLTGGVVVVLADGQPVETRNRVSLCRCGNSTNKPYCDGTHLSVGFTDARETTADA